MEQEDRSGARGAVVAAVSAGISLLVAAVVILAVLLGQTRHDLSEARQRVEAMSTEQLATQEEFGQLRSQLSSLQSQLAAEESKARGAEQKAKEYRLRIKRITACTDEILDAYNLNEFYIDIGRALEDALFSQVCGGEGRFPS